MQRDPRVHDETAPPTGDWHDIDSELTCSSREANVGFGILGPSEAMDRLRRSARQRNMPKPWSVRKGASAPSRKTAAASHP